LFFFVHQKGTASTHNEHSPGSDAKASGGASPNSEHIPSLVYQSQVWQTIGGSALMVAR
jgi:hypothetical protein